MDIFDTTANDSFYSPIGNPQIFANGQLEEQVRVDRKLYERLLSADSDIFSSGQAAAAADFFRNIMITTQTEIKWPRQLQSNTRSRKDPHIRISGLPAAVEHAKSIINSLLDTRINRVTLKMDVSFTDHSHVIGRGGRSIQRIMDCTGCHIHFPDGNRTNSYEKSNQVSIAGSAQGAEQARIRVREMLPVSVHYELPLNILVQSSLDPRSGPLQTLQNNYGITVTLKPITSFMGMFEVGQVTGVEVIVRGSRAQVLQLQLGISHLLNLMTAGALQFSSTPATIETEIAAQHHAFVMGRGNCNLRHITQTTGATVFFPEPAVTYFDAPAPTASSVPNKRSNVRIRGRNFECVYKGWLELINFLPLLLIFDLPEGKDCTPALISQLTDEMRVAITVKPKQKQNSKSVMVRAAERQSQNLFEVRRQILDLDHSEEPRTCESPLWPQNFSSTRAESLPPPTPTGTLSRVGSASSFLDSRTRVPLETSLSTIFSQKRGVTGRLDTIESVGTDAGSECGQWYRSFFDGNNLTHLSENFQADDVFASSLTREDLNRWQQNTTAITEDEADGAKNDMSRPCSEFGSILSQTFPNHNWRRPIARDDRQSLSRIENGRGLDSECCVS